MRKRFVAAALAVVLGACGVGDPELDDELGETTECYDCTANRYTERGQNLFGKYVQAWVAAGKP